jgi:hypothetical protein
MDLEEFASLVRLANPYQTRYATCPEKEVRPKPSLTSQRFVLTLFHLAGSTNSEGYDHALLNVFGDSEPPHRASLSKARATVSWTFFRDALELLVRKVEPRRTIFGGLKLFAIDGHQLNLPYTKDIYTAGYSGFPLEDGRETYSLKAYMSHCFDVLTGVTCGVTFSPLLDEHRDRRTLLDKVPDKSLVLYDRNYFSEDLVKAHADRDKVYFLARCKKAATREIEAFSKDSSKLRSSTRRYGKQIYFFKASHPETGEMTIYATDLPESWHKIELIQRLYRMRWEIETEQRDITETVKLEQWHSTTINGILQEFYATLWLVNFVKIAMLAAGQDSVSPGDDVYRKANFKLCFNYIVKDLAKWLSAPAALIIRIAGIIRRTSEKRRRYSRSYPREIKRPQCAYTYNNVVNSQARPPPGR